MVNARLPDRSVIGFLLVTLGIMFLIDTTDALGLGFNIVGTFWPALLIIWGLWGLIGRGSRFRLFSFLVLFIGVVFLLSTLNLLNLWEWGFGQLWPVLLVLAGVLLLFGNRLRPRRRQRRGWRERLGPSGPTERTRHGDGSPSRAGTGPARDFRASHIFGGGKEQVTAQDFQSGEVSAIFGGMELDLRDAELAQGGAVLDVTVVCGGIKLRVPRDWKVNTQTTTLFGGVENKRSQPSPGDGKGVLIITGAVICGGIEVKD